MKLIIAYIQPERLPDVKRALQARSVARISVTNAMGAGSQLGYAEHYRGAEREVTLHKKVRIECAVNDDFVDTTIEGIIEGARTGEIGDGKIFVVPLERCIRIRTGDDGNTAIG
jgi:nitrogen regulatory protein P-II 1